MKKLNFLRALFLALVLSAGFTSCIEAYEEPEVDHFAVLTQYMVQNNMDLNNMTTDWVIDAAAFNTAGVTNSYVIDLRSAADFATGHIQGAVNSTLANVVTTAAGAGNKPIVITCYTGQNAAVGLVALRLSGYRNCKILKWGMSGWNAKFDRWTSNISDRALQSPNWSSTNTIKQPVSFGYPKTAATESTGEAILRERVAYMLSKGLQSVASADVLAAPSNYFINNYWTEANVNQYGHIKGAYRINETLKIANDGLKSLDPNSTIVIYCWTGQTSALVSAYLNVLGYNAKSISFGANSMINSQLQQNKWTVPGNFPYVTN